MGESSGNGGRPIDRTSARRQARMRAKFGAPVKAYLDPQLRARLDRCAAARHLTIAELLRDALTLFLDVQELGGGVRPGAGSDRSANLAELSAPD